MEGVDTPNAPSRDGPEHILYLPFSMIITRYRYNNQYLGSKYSSNLHSIYRHHTFSQPVADLEVDGRGGES